MRPLRALIAPYERFQDRASRNPPELHPRWGVLSSTNLQRRTAMPVFILWAIPAVIVLGGGAYWIMHVH
jgi:hypothetical protein